jgi:hypothetical protein
VARKSGKKIKTPHRPRFVPPPGTDSTVGQADRENVPMRETLQLLMSNRPGFFGFLLSLLQLIGHAAWIMLIWYFGTTGKAKSLTSDSFESWLIVGILGVSLLLTAVALFVCLFYGLRREPRSLAVIGFFLSFFVGVLATACVFMQAVRAMSPANS